MLKHFNWKRLFSLHFLHEFDSTVGFVSFVFSWLHLFTHFYLGLLHKYAIFRPVISFIQQSEHTIHDPRSMAWEYFSNDLQRKIWILKQSKSIVVTTTTTLIEQMHKVNVWFTLHSRSFITDFESEIYSAIAFASWTRNWLHYVKT